MIKVLYFARIAELTGTRQEQIPLPASHTSTAFLALLRERHPALADVKNLKMAINQDHAAANATLRAGDEVALFEPVTGG